MKKIFIVLATAMMSVSVMQGGTPAELRGRLQKMVDNRQFAFGHHDDTAYGHNWEYQPDSSDVRSITGDYPAILNWDLGLIEWGSDKELDGVPFEFIREQVRLHDSRGGINSFSWHPRNPVTKGDSWDTQGGNIVRRSVTPGDPINDEMVRWIVAAADFIASLTDDRGEQIAVIFRPWHEHTGEWFWWGKTHCDTKDYTDLWHLTRRIFDERGATNVVWAYSPDKSNVADYEQYMERYPGDDYVDIMGADVYHFNGTEGNAIFREWMHATLGSAVRAAREHGKIAALTETGCEGLTLNNWYMGVLYPEIRDYPIAYITVWRNGYNMDKHYYVPFPGHPATADFVEFYNLPQTLFLGDLR